MFSQNRDQLRQVFQASWDKYRQQQPLQGIESLIVTVIQQHPEYQPLFTDPDALHQDYTQQTNPFLHMGMHITLAEQLQADRPNGIRHIYQSLLKRTPDQHQVEHQMLDCLAQTLWEAQSTQRPPDEAAYLAQLQKI
ncbi:MAG: DUF1841 family protein [Pseudomonadota bacterium]